MKSLMFGYYGEVPNFRFIEKNIDLFSAFKSREIIRIHLPKLILLIFKGSTGYRMYENDRFYVVITGECFAEDVNINIYDSSIKLFKDLIRISDGLFTICVYDKVYDKMLLSNDRYALLPLFYRVLNKNEILFCNEYEPLITYEDNLLPLNKKQIKTFLNYGFTSEGKTFFKGVRKNIKSTYIIADKKLKFIRYKWGVGKKYSTYEEWINLVYMTLKLSVEKMVGNDSENVNVAITGGLDSRLVFGLIPPDKIHNISYFTFPTKPLDETNDKDVIVAKKLCNYFSLKHNIVVNNEKTAPMSIKYFENKRIDVGKVFVTGILGGEAFSPSSYHNVIPTCYRDGVMGKIKESVKRLFLKKDGMNNSLWFFFEKMSSSFFTSFYDGTEGAWSQPWSNFLLYNTPFTNSNFLDLVFAEPSYLESEKHSAILDIYNKFFPQLKAVPITSNKKLLLDYGFTFETEGFISQEKKIKKSTNNLDTARLMQGFKYIPDKYKNNNYLSKEEFRQRVIDFCFWYEYIHMKVIIDKQ